MLKNLNLLGNLYKLRVWLLACAIPIIIFFICNPNYLRKNTFFWVALITLPVSIQPSSNKPIPFYFIGIGLSIMFFILPSTFWIYLILSFIILFLIQKLVGSISLISIVHISLISPLFIYFNSLVSFPIRLKLSQWVTEILLLIGHPATIEGNVVKSMGNSFLIDEACSGLHMLGYGLLFGTIILIQVAKNYQIRFLELTGYYIVLLLLILTSNLVRITFLIIFVVMPEHWFHEVLGWLVFLVQILIPFYFLVKHGYRLFGKSKKEVNTNKTYYNVQFPWFSYLMIATPFLMINIQNLQQSKSDHFANFKSTEITGHGFTAISKKVIKYENDQSLIYIKCPVPPYKADHNPMICWQGSGYLFKKITQKKINGVKVNIAELVKGNEVLQTAWWFESTHSQTGNQFGWRKTSFLNNEQFYLINVTNNSLADLENQVSVLLNQKIISSQSLKTS